MPVARVSLRRDRRVPPADARQSASIGQHGDPRQCTAAGAAHAGRGPRGASAMTRPFRVLGVQQIAIGGPSKAALRRLWVDLFGVPAIGTYHSERENVDEDILAIAGVEIDLMEPIDPERKPKVNEPPLNHIGLWVDDLPAAFAWLSEQGMRFAPG